MIVAVAHGLAPISDRKDPVSAHLMSVGLRSRACTELTPSAFCAVPLAGLAAGRCPVETYLAEYSTADKDKYSNRADYSFSRLAWVLLRVRGCAGAPRSGAIGWRGRPTGWRGGPARLAWRARAAGVAARGLAWRARAAGAVGWRGWRMGGRNLALFAGRSVFPILSPLTGKWRSWSYPYQDEPRKLRHSRLA
jgi:hypothetical protein